LEGIDPQDFRGLVDALTDGDSLDPPMSEAQALNFLGFEKLENGTLALVEGTGFEIIDQYIPTSIDSSGFSATVFRNRETGEYHFVNRGTEPNSLADLLTDIEAVFSGGAEKKIKGSEYLKAGQEFNSL